MPRGATPGLEPRQGGSDKATPGPLVDTAGVDHDGVVALLKAILTDLPRLSGALPGMARAVRPPSPGVRPPRRSRGLSNVPRRGPGAPESLPN